MKFDIYQKEVIETNNRNLLVIAGPGAGKTTTILEKVNNLLKTGNEKDILLLSFTNKSVDDIKNKLNNPNIDIFTFHNLAIEVLNTYNFKFKICNQTYLEYIIDEYLQTNLTNNELYEINKIKKYNDYNYTQLKKLIITFINLFKTNNHDFNKLKTIINEKKQKKLIIIILNILNIYEQEKKSQNLLDFDDLIITATALLKNNYQFRRYKYIIVDEAQDTSYIRLELIKQIYINSQSIITFVGDDFQSIFHFTGCDLDIFVNFKKYFNNYKIINLKNTYRNSQELINITSKFINKNPYQIKKTMISNLHIQKPIEYIYYFNPKKSFKRLLNSLKNKNIMIISRNKNDIYNYIDNEFKIINNTLIYKDKRFKYLTIHSSKGLEEDYVIILNLSNNKYGIPNKIINSDILKYVTNKCDNYKYSEERRLFFVGLTRCKYKVYLLIPFINPSIFIKELKKLDK